MIDNIRKLIDKLNKANFSYYQEDKSIISDFEYDKLYDKLRDLELETGIILSNSPTQNVGSIVVGKLEKVEHKRKMLSLDKTKNKAKIVDFIGDKKAMLSYKMDGLTIVLQYENGGLLSAITRGNGEIGENVTHNARVFRNIPLTIPFKGNLGIRGEALISFTEFEKINSSIEYEDKYKNTRNLCSGTVRQLDSNLVKERNVDFLAFSLVDMEKDFNLKSEQLDFLKSLGFNVVKYNIIDKNNAIDTIDEFTKNINKIDYALDGLVITFDDIAYSKNLGQTAKFPKDSIAFKWQDDLAKTTLLDVEWNTSRTGLINPIAVFEPVELEGTTVTRASLHNVSIIKSLKLGLGDTINVYKANMIIPQIEGNNTKSDTLIIPKNCSACGAKTEILEDNDCLFLKCTNSKCIAIVIGSITHYVSRDCMNIAGFSKATIEKFIEEGFIKDYTDIYCINKFEDKIVNLKGFGQKSYDNLINAIETSKNTTIENFVNALGIENIGLNSAKLLAKTFDYDFNKIRAATFDELINIDGFGDILAKSVVSYFSNNDNLANINKTICNLNFINKTIDNETALDGKTFVITGNIEHFKNRKELQQKIENLGGIVTNSVSKNTNFLINNNKNSTSSKNKKAMELDISIINEDEFLELINSI